MFLPMQHCRPGSGGASEKIGAVRGYAESAHRLPVVSRATKWLPSACAPPPLARTRAFHDVIHRRDFTDYLHLTHEGNRIEDHLFSKDDPLCPQAASPSARPKTAASRRAAACGQSAAALSTAGFDAAKRGLTALPRPWIAIASCLPGIRPRPPSVTWSPLPPKFPTPQVSLPRLGVGSCVSAISRSSTGRPAWPLPGDSTREAGAQSAPRRCASARHRCALGQPSACSPADQV